jgi:ATP-dependent RNA helicase RhlE
VKNKGEMKGYDPMPSKGKKKNYLGSHGWGKRQEGIKEKRIYNRKGGRREGGREGGRKEGREGGREEVREVGWGGES